MEVGHHTAYDFAMAVAAGYVDVDKALVRLKAEKDDLEYSIMAYGVAAVLKQDGRREEALELIREIVRRDGFWISYAYIAAWNDVSYQKGFLTK
jgi:thioredoxin-like negative regulator of GroEL